MKIIKPQNRGIELKTVEYGECFTLGADSSIVHMVIRHVGPALKPGEVVTVNLSDGTTCIRADDKTVVPRNMACMEIDE